MNDFIVKCDTCKKDVDRFNCMQHSKRVLHKVLSWFICYSCKDLEAQKAMQQQQQLNLEQVQR